MLPRHHGGEHSRRKGVGRLRLLRLRLLPCRRIFALVAVLCFLLGATLLWSRLWTNDPFASLPRLPLPSLSTNTGEGTRHRLDAVLPSRIIALIPPVFPSLGRLLQDLTAADYASHKIGLDLVLAPLPDARNSDGGDVRVHLAAMHAWPHGHYSVRHASSAGRFDMLLDAWTPARGDDSRVIIFDSATSNFTFPGANWFCALKRHLKARQTVDVAGFALEPGKIRRAAAWDDSFSDEDVGFPSQGVGDEDAYAYQALTQATGAVFMPASSEVWRAFQSWFGVHRGEWFLWPVVSAAKDKNDPVWNAFRGTTRAHWTSWFTRFCAEYELYTVYPRKSILQASSVADGDASGATKVERPARRMPRYDYAGRLVERKLAVAEASLEKIEKLAWRDGRGGTVSMTVVSESFIATARSWICNVDTAGIRPPGIVWIAVDEASRDAMSEVPDSETVYLSELGEGREDAGTSYGTPGYWLLMLERTKLIREILERGVGIFAFETDQIWLRDPVPYVTRLVHGGDHVDVVGTLDTRHEIGGNFLYLNPTLATRRLWREVSTRFDKAFQASKMDGHKALTSKKRKWRYIENDQSLLTRLTLFDEALRARGNAAVFRALDLDLFADGRWYGEDEKDHTAYYSGSKARAPVLINNNFLIGIDKKVERARRHGHWFLDDEDSRCAPEKVKAAVAANEQRARTAYGDGGWVEVGDIETSLDFAITAIARERVVAQL